MERLESLIGELEGGTLDESLRRRCEGALADGYAVALELEGQRRRLRERERLLLAASDGTDATLQELVALARRELELAREEKALRALLGRLHDRTEAAIEACQPPGALESS